MIREALDSARASRRAEVGLYRSARHRHVSSAIRSKYMRSARCSGREREARAAVVDRLGEDRLSATLEVGGGRDGAHQARARPCRTGRPPAHLHFTHAEPGAHSTGADFPLRVPTSPRRPGSRSTWRRIGRRQLVRVQRHQRTRCRGKRRRRARLRPPLVLRSLRQRARASHPLRRRPALGGRARICLRSRRAILGRRSQSSRVVTPTRSLIPPLTGSRVATTTSCWLTSAEPPTPVARTSVSVLRWSCARSLSCAHRLQRLRTGKSRHSGTKPSAGMQRSGRFDDHQCAACAVPHARARIHHGGFRPPLRGHELPRPERRRAYRSWRGHHRAHR